MSKDTHRGYPRPKAFNRVRDEIVRLVSDKIAGKSYAWLYDKTGIQMRRQKKYEFLEGDLSSLSDNRLFLLAEGLGIRFDIQVAA